MAMSVRMDSALPTAKLNALATTCGWIPVCTRSGTVRRAIIVSREMHTFVEQALRSRQQRPRDDHDRRGAVPRLNVLRIRQVHHLHAARYVLGLAGGLAASLGSNHLRGGVLHFHALDDGGTVIRDDDVAAGRDDLRQARILAAGAELCRGVR